MSVVSCPHCGKTRIATAKAPRDVVVMMPCPECHELVALFRGKVIGINRDILENGSKEDRKNHIAELIEEFLPPELLSGEFDWSMPSGASFTPNKPRRRPRRKLPEFLQGSDCEDLENISDEEYERFLKFELDRIDEPRYFKKYFG